jgi:hypothetical protein
MTDMNMALKRDVTDSMLAPVCQHCGSATRLYGIEPHPAFPRTDIRTYACTGCEGVEVIQVLLPLQS